MHEIIYAKMGIHKYIAVMAITLVVGSIPGCTPLGMGSPGPVSASGGGINFDELPDAVPQAEFKSRSGNPESYVIEGTTYRVLRTSDGYREEGIASWYGGYFHGRRTSSGDTYDMYQMTAAHQRLPLPTYLRVTPLEYASAVVAGGHARRGSVRSLAASCRAENTC